MISFSKKLYGAKLILF